ncbi:hypothetical protein [Paenibacillus sp. GCM10027626]|uniref:hypothetical protein n=1 Tax=Paenibacillus sp. GCM10027626 TaxID=3273411 RepID=UPI0036410B30
MNNQQTKRIIRPADALLQLAVEEAGGVYAVTAATADGASPLVLDGGEQFVLVTGEGEEDSRQYCASDCGLRGFKWESNSFELHLEEHSRLFQAVIRYEVLAGGFIRKTAAITPLQQPLFIRELTYAFYNYAGPIVQAGEGQPVRLGDSWFAGMAFPAAESGAVPGGCTFRFRVNKLVQGNSRWEAYPLVCGINAGKGLGEAFQRYVAAYGLRKQQPISIYCDWGLHDELSDAIELTEAMTLDMLAHLQWMKEQTGIAFDYYLIDAFWFEPNGGYKSFKRSHWPGGPAKVKAKMEELGIKLGLWFDVNSKFLGMQGMEDARIDHTEAALCLGDDGYWELLRDGLLHHIRHHGLKLAKFDFAQFECAQPGHAHLPGEQSRPQLIRRFLELLAEVRDAEPEFVVLAYNGFTADYTWIKDVDSSKEGYAVSPWWTLYVDYIYCGDPRPSELPALRLRDSIHSYTDAMIKQFTDAWVPYSAIDDHGIMIGNTGTIYRIGKEGWRNDWVLSFSRGNRKKHLYGDLTSLDENDYIFLRQAWLLADRAEEAGYTTAMVLGSPLKEQLYGYVNGNRKEGFITIFNPFPEVSSITVEAELAQWCGVEAAQISISQVYGGESWQVPSTWQTALAPIELPPFEVAMFSWTCEREAGEAEVHGLEKRYGPHAKLLLPFTSGSAANGMAIELQLSEGSYLIAKYRDAAGRPLRITTGKPDHVTLQLKAGVSGEQGGSTLKLEPIFTDEIWSGISWMAYQLPRPQDGAATLQLYVQVGEGIAVAIQLEQWSTFQNNN